MNKACGAASLAKNPGFEVLVEGSAGTVGTVTFSVTGAITVG